MIIWLSKVQRAVRVAASSDVIIPELFLPPDVPKLGSCKPFLWDYVMRFQNCSIVQGSFMIKSTAFCIAKILFYIAPRLSDYGFVLKWQPCLACFRIVGSCLLFSRAGFTVCRARANISEKWHVSSIVTIVVLYLNSQRCIFTKKKRENQNPLCSGFYLSIWGTFIDKMEMYSTELSVLDRMLLCSVIFMM